MRQAMERGGGDTIFGQITAVNPFQAYNPPPGVLPPGREPALAMDSDLASWANDSFSSAMSMSGGFGAAFAEGLAFLGYAYLSELTLRPEYRRMGERLATEMTRKWIRLTIASEGEDDTDEDDDGKKVAQDKAPTSKISIAAERTPEEDDDEAALQKQRPKPKPVEVSPEQKARERKLRKINERMKKLDVRGRFKNVAEYDCWMGRSHLYIDTGDGDDPAELLTDLGDGSNDVSKRKFKKGSFKALKHIEPVWCYPVRYNATDPLADDWYRPDVWFAMQKQIHRSRLLTFVGREVPDLLKPAYAFGGLSLSQMAKPYVDNWLRTRQAVTDLIESFSVSGIYTNAQSLLQGGGEEVVDRIELFAETRQNMGSMVLDKETEEFFNVSTPLGTLDALQAQSQEQLSSVSGLPLIVLLGITPTGLNASSEGELRVFYDFVNAMQESLWRYKLQTIINFIQLDLYGEVDPAIGFEFEPLWSLDEKGQAEVRKIEAETHTIYVDLGAIGQGEVRSVIVSDENSPYNGLPPEHLPDLAEEEEEGLVVKGGKAQGGAGGESEDDGGGANDAVIPFVHTAWDEFNESDHPRAPDGKFGSTGAQSLSKSAKELKLDKAAKVSEKLHSKLVDLNDEFNGVISDVWDVTPEDRADLDEGMEFEAEQNAQEYAYEKAPAVVAKVRNNLVDIANKLDALAGDKPEGSSFKKLSLEEFGLSHIQSGEISRIVQDISGRFEELNSTSDNLHHLIHGLDEDGDRISDEDIDAEEVESDIVDAEEALREEIGNLRDELRAALEEVDQVINNEHDDVSKQHSEYRKDFDRWKNMSSAARAAEEAAQRQEAAKQKDEVYKHRENVITKALSSGWKPEYKENGGIAWNSVPEEVKNVASSPAGAAQMLKILGESGYGSKG